jgi:hypothetical protein
MKTVAEEGTYVSLRVGEGLLSDIDEFRFVWRFESRTAAMQWLLRAALDKKLAPTPKSATRKKGGERGSR